MKGVPHFGPAHDALAAIRSNRDDYPVTNIRWSYGIAFFIAPCALVGVQEGSLRFTIGGALFGLATCLFFSLAAYGANRYQESLIARITLALIITSIATLVLVCLFMLFLFAGTVLAGVLSATAPVVLIGIVLAVIFAGSMYLLS